jgi:hypothetical protein
MLQQQAMFDVSNVDPGTVCRDVPSPKAETFWSGRKIIWGTKKTPRTHKHIHIGYFQQRE